MFMFIHWLAHLFNVSILHQLSICKMSKTRSKKSGYTKVGDYVELRVPRDAKYEDVARSAATAVGLNDPTDSSSDEDIAHSKGTLVLLRADGTRVPNTPLSDDLSAPWTIHDYMCGFPTYRRTATAVKLGVGYTAPVSCNLLKCTAYF